jgi:hypothetical protein
MRAFDIPAYVLLALIWVYQRTFSLDHGPLRSLFPHGYCQFHPTCSEYARRALKKHGSPKGAYLALKRILRCHPWSSGGVDHP